MKRMTALASALLILALMLAGCTVPEPDYEALGWEEDWVALGDILAVEDPEGFALRERVNNLSVYGFRYAVWSVGEESSYVNAAGKDAKCYDAEVYLLVQECKSETEAKNMLLEWEARERLNYDCGENTGVSGAGQEYTVVPILSPLEGTVPYAWGLAALGFRGTCAVSVELLCREGYECDAQGILTAFLESFHYNETRG